MADKNKFDRIGRIVWLTQFFISAQNFFSSPPYYAVWNHPHLIILSAFSFSQSFNFAYVFFYQCTKWDQDFFGRLVPKNQYNFDVFFWFLEIQTKHGRKKLLIKKIIFFFKSDLTTNIFMLVNLEPIFGFILEISSIPNYLHGHTVVAMCFIMGHLVKQSGKNEAELEVSILTWPKKGHIL